MVLTSKFKEIVNNVGTRVLKVLSIGGAMQSKEAMPFGFDGNPLKDMIAVYSNTSNASQRYIIGYINKNQLAKAGESRMYSIDSSGVLQAYIWNKADGTLELNGDAFSAVRYQNLKTQFDLLQQQINTQWPLIASGIATGGGTYVPTNVNVDISSAESPDVKLK